MGLKRRQSRIAFGSCNEQDRENRLWKIIESRNPAAFVWGGDSIYADQEHPTNLFTFPPQFSHVECGTPDRVRALYKQQSRVPGYRQLLKGNITVFGTIDDHDYGCDNADKNFPYKAETTRAFLDFIGEESGSPLSKRVAKGRGVYGVKLFDFDRLEGEELVPEEEACIDPDVTCISSEMSSISKKSVAVFFLDVRSNKDPWQSSWRSFFSKDTKGDLLGEEQWQWLEAALPASNAAVNVIVSGLQINGDFIPNPNWAESWNGFPRSQQRLYDIVLNDSVSAPLLVSGDVHLTQMMRKDCWKGNDPTSRRPLFELTTSGMTHSWGGLANPLLHESDAIKPGIFTVAFQHFNSAFGRMAMHSLHWWRNWSHLLVSSVHNGVEYNGGAEGAKQGLQYSLNRNFGELEFDWVEGAVSIRSIGEDGKPLLASRVQLSQLSGEFPVSASIDFSEAQKSSSNRPHGVDGDWTCVGYRNSASSLSSIQESQLRLTVLFLAMGLFVFVTRLISISGKRFSVRRKAVIERSSTSLSYGF